MGVISPAKADSAVDHGNESGVSDGDAVSIAREVGQDLQGSGEGLLGINDPVALGSGAQESSKSRRRLERSQLAGESELVFLESCFKSCEKFSAKYKTQYFNGQKKLLSAGNPSPMIGREPSSGYDAMHMRMMKQSLSPSVQHGEESDFGAEVFGIGGDLEEGLSRSTKQQAVEQSLILQCQRGQDMGQGEYDMIVRNRQQFGRALGQPALSCCRLALWAVAIQTRVVRDGLLSAAIALLDVPAERSGTASGNRAKDFEVQKSHPAAMPVQESCAIGPNNVGHLEGWPSHFLEDSFVKFKLSRGLAVARTCC